MKLFSLTRVAGKYFCGISLLAASLLPFAAQAGSLDSPAVPADAGSAMHSLEDVYNRLDSGAAGAKRSGAFNEPTAGPGSTGHTLDEVMTLAPAADNTNGAAPADVGNGKTYWGLRTDGSWGGQTGTANISAYPAQVTQSGQTSSYAAGDDGAIQAGIVPPTPRFTDNSDGTVTDNLTGLIWLKNANCWGVYPWTTQLTHANNLGNGQCGLTDGSAAGDWRLPQVKELQSLIDFSNYNPALPSGQPFTGVQSNNYWSSTTLAFNTALAWLVYLDYGTVVGTDKTSSYYVWPVRGGQ